MDLKMITTATLGLCIAAAPLDEPVAAAQDKSVRMKSGKRARIACRKELGLGPVGQGPPFTIITEMRIQECIARKMK
jgi:hypothetical protein